MNYPRNRSLFLLFPLAALLVVATPTRSAAAPAGVLLRQQQTPDPYRQALEFFRQGRYQRASELLEPALQAGGLGADRASAWLLLAASHLGADAPEPALQALASLDREFPEGPYAVERRWLRGRAHSRAGRYVEAAREYAAVVAADPNGRLGAAARDALAGLITTSMSDADLQRLGADLAGTELKAWLLLEAADVLSGRGDLGRARRLLDRVEAETPEDGYTRDTERRLQDLQERLTAAAPSGLILGVLLPLTGPDSEQGKEIMNAVRLAVGRAGADVELVWRDTGGTLEGTVKGALSLIRTEGAHVLIGPYFEELALVASGEAEAMGVPILLPFTQGAAPPTLGENIFQLQATSRVQARFLADAAIDSLGMRTFAVLNPATGSGPDFAETFMTRVEEKGGSVISHQVYFPGGADYRTQLEAIRLEALALSLADTTDISISDREAILAANRDTLDALVPVGSLDALVVPGLNAMDTVAIGIQADFLNLVTTILGGSSWNSYEVVRAGQHYVEGAVFTDTYSAGYVSTAQVEFANQFYATYGHQPDRSAAYAFDAANLAMTAWRLEGSRSPDPRAAIRRWLTGVQTFEGVTGNVDLATNARINDSVFLLQIRDRRIVPWSR